MWQPLYQRLRELSRGDSKVRYFVIENRLIPG